MLLIIDQFLDSCHQVLSTFSLFRPEFRKMLINSSPEPKIGVAYKKKCVQNIQETGSQNTCFPNIQEKEIVDHPLLL